MGAIASFVPSDEEVDEAWESYRAKAARYIANPNLYLDRAFREDLIRSEQAFRSLFLRQDTGSRQQGAR